MSVTYYERPPASARAARRAWDHFAATKGKTRGVRELFYSPNYEYTGCPHWVCILNMRETDTMRWAFSMDDLTWAIAAHTLAPKDTTP